LKSQVQSTSTSKPVWDLREYRDLRAILAILDLKVTPVQLDLLDLKATLAM
jgi:hypothetical protein